MAKAKSKETITLKEAAKKIDVDKVTAEGLAGLIHENANLKRRIIELEADLLKPRMPDQLTVPMYNWYCENLENARKAFLEAIHPPAPLSEDVPKLITLS